MQATPIELYQQTNQAQLPTSQTNKMSYTVWDIGSVDASAVLVKIPMSTLNADGNYEGFAFNARINLQTTTVSGLKEFLMQKYRVKGFHCKTYWGFTLCDDTKTLAACGISANGTIRMMQKTERECNEAADRARQSLSEPVRHNDELIRQAEERIRHNEERLRQAEEHAKQAEEQRARITAERIRGAQERARQAEEALQETQRRIRREQDAMIRKVQDKYADALRKLEDRLQATEERARNAENICVVLQTEVRHQAVSSRDCPICFQTLNASVALRPCGHVMCSDCAPLFQQCPCCRTDIHSTLRIFPTHTQ